MTNPNPDPNPDPYPDIWPTGITAKQPVLIAGLFAVAVTATITGIAFAFKWSSEATALILGATDAWVALGTAVWVWKRVTPV